MPTELSGYRTLGQIGIGARSTISHVQRVTTSQVYALKRVVRRNPEDNRFLEQVEVEYAVSSAIEHPNLRHSYELHRFKKWFRVNELLLLMEYVSGRTLEQDRPESLPEILAIFKQVATGLDALHESGYVHADIKPNNIILTNDGGVKIIDFGQSCPMGHKKDRIQGTPDYIAPEQVRRLPLDRRTDVFNLGATLYWVLTNKTFPTDIRQNTRPGSHEIVGATRPPKELNPGVPAALSTLVMDCCSSNPDGRPPDMQRVIARLNAVERRWRDQLSDHEGSGNGPVSRDTERKGGNELKEPKPPKAAKPKKVTDARSKPQTDQHSR
jgi:serine/threonine-protein kinase